MARNEGCRAVSEREGPGGPQQIEDPAEALQGDDGEAAEICTIEDKDFRAKFDGQGWTVTYLFNPQAAGPYLTHLPVGRGVFSNTVNHSKSVINNFMGN